MNSAISLENVSKSLGNHEILKDISLSTELKDIARKKSQGR